MEIDDVDRLASRDCCPEVIEDFTEGDVLQEDGFILKTKQPRLFHLGEHELLPNALCGTDGRLTIKLEGPVLLLS